MTRAAPLLVALAVSALGAAPPPADAHLFHQVYEPPENQLTKDARLLHLLVDDPTDRFELARAVYEGRTRVRIKPGGFRKWLTRPLEPGMVFKADYQLHRWPGSLRTEAERIDRDRGSDLAVRIDHGLRARDRGSVVAAMRGMFAVLLDELLASLWERLDDQETAARLYAWALAYYSVNLEGFLNISDPSAATTARTALDAMGRALGDPETGAPAAPEAFDKQRRRLLRVLREATARP